MAKSFQKLPLIAKIILLLIPGVNWITEIVVRISSLIEKPNLYNAIGFIICVVGNVVFGWLDLIWIILFGHLLLSKV